jgi:long-chain acyl-CoA synthetase
MNVLEESQNIQQGQEEQRAYQFNNLYQILEKNFIEAPNKTIIFEEDLKINNLQFKKYVDNIAKFLSDAEIKPRDKVALVMSNCWQFIANLFAVSKLGGIVVPINNFLKEDELVYIINDSQAKLLFSSAKFATETKELLTKTSINKIVWVDGCPIENDENIDFSKIDLDGSVLDHISYTPYENKLEDTAFVVYTSGTTGKPKGAMLSYKNIFSNCEGSKILMGVQDGQIKMICYLPMFHAFTLTATVILPIYTNSGVIVIKSISSKKDFKYLLKQLLLQRCRYFTGVPDVYSAMARAKLPWYFHWFHNVRGFISGAAPLSDEISQRFASAFKRGKLLQGYGISECSPIVSCNSPEDNVIGSVGRPLYGYQVKIMSEDGRNLPAHGIGEIYIKGDCVMQGYYNRPDETSDAIQNGWFKTGDIGYLDDTGHIFIVDRKKDVIIHKGMNIYPREIEEVLYTNDKINACAVVGFKEKDGVESPVVYIELREDQVLTENEVKDFLRPKVATFKLPRKVFFMDKLPRNATQKILKRELRELCNSENSGDSVNNINNGDKQE